MSDETGYHVQTTGGAIRALEKLMQRELAGQRDCDVEAGDTEELSRLNQQLDDINEDLHDAVYLNEQLTSANDSLGIDLTKAETALGVANIENVAQRRTIERLERDIASEQARCSRLANRCIVAVEESRK